MEHVSTISATGTANFSVSDEGSLIYAAGGAPSPERQLVWVDRDGRAEAISDERRRYVYVRLSPDGGRLAVAVDGATNHVWACDLAACAFTRLTFAWDNNYPIWTPDGAYVTFGSNPDGQPGLFLQAADGTGDVRRLTTSNFAQQPGSWSRDGRLLLFTQRDPSTGFDVWMLNRESGQAAQPFLQTRFDESHPQLSPDSRWIAYVSSESGRNEVYLRQFPDAGAKRQISTGGGDAVIWSRDGRTLFYRNADQMMAIQIGTGRELTATRGRPLFKGPYMTGGVGLGGGTGIDFDVAPDGRRFAMILPAEPESLHEIALVENWFTDLRRRVPR